MGGLDESANGVAERRFDPVSDMNNWGGGGQGSGDGTYEGVAWQGTFDGRCRYASV